MKDNSKITLIYEYAQQALKDLISSKNALNTKLAAVIGFDAALIRFSLDLPDKCLTIDCANVDIHLNCDLCLCLKVLSCTSLIISLVFALWAFVSQKGGAIILPESLMDKCSEDNYKESMIAMWNKSIKELGSIIDKTGKLFNCAVLFLGFAAILSAIDIILASLIE